MRYLWSAIVAVALLPALSARADEVIRKGGEWQSTVTGIGPEPRTMTLCYAQTTFEQAIARIAPGTTCTKRNVTRNGNQVNMDIACGGMAMQGTVTLSGDTAYTADVTTRVVHGQDVQVFHSTTAAQWIGACKPGEKVMGGG